MCDADDRYIWLGILLVYKGLLLTAGLLLAFDTRKVNLKHLGDSHHLKTSFYVLGGLSLALTIVNLLLEEFIDALYAVTGGLVMVGAVFLLCLIFLRQVRLICVVSLTRYPSVIAKACFTTVAVISFIEYTGLN